MKFFYPPGETMPGRPFSVEQQLTISPNGTGNAYFRDFRGGRFGVTAFHVENLGRYDVDIIKHAQGGTRTLIEGLEDKAFEHAFVSTGYELPVPLTIGQGEDLEFVLSDRTGSQDTVSVQARGLTPEQMRVRKESVRRFLGAVPDVAFGYVSFEATSNQITEQSVNVPKGQWAFDRLLLDIDNTATAVPTTTFRKDDESVIFRQIPFEQEQVPIAPTRVERRLDLEVDFTDAAPGDPDASVDLLIPLFSAADLPYDLQ